MDLNHRERLAGRQRDPNLKDTAALPQSKHAPEPAFGNSTPGAITRCLAVTNLESRRCVVPLSQSTVAFWQRGGSVRTLEWRWAQ